MDKHNFSSEEMLKHVALHILLHNLLTIIDC